MNGFKLINKYDVPENKQILPSRFVFVTKRSGKKKARLVAGGPLFGTHHAGPEISRLSLNIMLAAVVERGFVLGSSDFEQAYLNSLLKHAMYMRLPNDLHLLGELLKKSKSRRYYSSRTT